ncbi:MAG: selenide, water dikinase SelD [Ruthenibacterium sp.]
METNHLRLTQMARASGCAAKVGPGELSKVLNKLPPMPHADLLVGFDTSDDACVWKISEERYLVETVDFFPPIVDDPKSFGRIAAANALSDVYAMGGEPFLAMNLLCISSCLPPEIVQQILAGGCEKVLEAGAVIAGGHTIQDHEPKYGLCVSGFVAAERLLRNVGAQEGDVLLLTKPIGTGVMTTAMRGEMLTPEQAAPAVASMEFLNRTAARAADAFAVHACTDITGFGLLGHLSEMAQGSGKTIRLFADKVPFFAGAQALAQQGFLPAGAYANADYLAPQVQFADHIVRSVRDLLFDPQTSGGLLFCLPADAAQQLAAALTSKVPAVAIIGRVEAQGEKTIFVE